MTETRSSDATGLRPWSGHRAGTGGHRRIVVAMTAAGIATFAQLYSVQAVLPGLAATFDASAARVALTVSMATGGLAAFVLFWSGIADRFGRVRVMAVALALSTVLGVLAPFAPDLATLVALRAVQGAALGGLPAVAMAYLAEEIHPGHLGRAAGVYIAGNTVGGMAGRLLAGAVADLGGWRWGVAADAALGALTLVVFLAAIPRPRGFRPRRRERGGPGLARRVAASVTDPGLVALYCQGLFLMGAFVTVYNFLGFRLLGAPFGLPQAVVALLFVAYLAGTVSSAVAGRVIERVGRYPVLLASVAVMVAGVLALLPGTLAAVVPGLVVLTFGFFAAHTTASAWVGHRAAPAVRAQASALYTLGYYVGSSLFGWLGGVCYDRFGWCGVVGYVLALCAAAALSGLGLRFRREP
ncbi:MFS transporter [Marinactinospora rubrisoli]|uniref:MFS transporter n=1 Tax=Marinactinospora rubrisoli TaxID=2715399 RepID=A0ABW2KL96_9ACTN